MGRPKKFKNQSGILEQGERSPEGQHPKDAGSFPDRLYPDPEKTRKPFVPSWFNLTEVSYEPLRMESKYNIIS